MPSQNSGRLNRRKTIDKCFETATLFSVYERRIGKLKSQIEIFSFALFFRGGVELFTSKHWRRVPRSSAL